MKDAKALFAGCFEIIMVAFLRKKPYFIRKIESFTAIDVTMSSSVSHRQVSLYIYLLVFCFILIKEIRTGTHTLYRIQRK